MAEYDFSACSTNDRAWYLGTAWFVGFGLGAATAGFLADRFGRKAAAITNFIILVLGQAMYAGSPIFFGFALGRGISAFGHGGYGISTVVWLAEIINHRGLFLMAVWSGAFYNFGSCLAGVVGYNVMNWRLQAWYLLASMVPLLAILTVSIYESPKFLASMHGDKEKLLWVLNKIAETNGRKQLPPPTEPDEDECMPELVREDLRQLCHRKFYPRVLLLVLMWAGIGQAYYTLGSPAGGEKGNDYQYEIKENELRWSTPFLIEIVFYAVAAAMVQSPAYGRRGTVGTCMLVGAILEVLSNLEALAPESRKVVFQSLGFLSTNFFSMAFSGAYLFTMESVPNATRCVVLGIASFTARIGAALGAMLVNRGAALGFVPTLILGLLPVLLSGVCALQFPETRGRPLPGYLEDLHPMTLHAMPAL